MYITDAFITYVSLMFLLTLYILIIYIIYTCCSYNLLLYTIQITQGNKIITIKCSWHLKQRENEKKNNLNCAWVDSKIEEEGEREKK